MKAALIISTIFIGTLVKAQKTKFGVTTGYTLSFLKADPTFGNAVSYDSAPKHSFYLGGVAEHKFNEKFGIQGELLYSSLGGVETYEYKFFEEKNIFTTLELEFKTLQLPLLAKFYFDSNLSINGGANLISILSAKSISYSEFDIKDQTKSFNIIPFLGADYAFQNGLFLNVRYNVGVSDLSTYQRKLRNNFLQTGVGYKFGRQLIK